MVREITEAAIVKDRNWPGPIADMGVVSVGEVARTLGNDFMSMIDNSIGY